MQNVQAAWDEVKFIDGYPGIYYAVARRAGKKWYVAGINADSTQKNVSINFSFVGANKTGTMFNNKSNGEFETQQYPVNAKQDKVVTIKPNDGFVIVFE